MTKSVASARLDANCATRLPVAVIWAVASVSRGLQHFAGFGVDKMNSRASRTRHGFVNLAIRSMIGSNPASHLQTGSWAAVDEGNYHLPAIWEQRRSMALLILAKILFAWAIVTLSPNDNGAAATNKRI
jgi:hypothetical protein